MKTSYNKLYTDSSLGFSYYLTATDIAVEGVTHTRYGVAVYRPDGDGAQVLDVFPRREQAEALIERLYRGLVTPTTLRDVVYDSLFAAETA